MAASAPASIASFESAMHDSKFISFVPAYTVTRWSIRRMASRRSFLFSSVGMAKNSPMLPKSRMPSIPFSIR